MASIIKADTLQSTTANVFILNSSGTEYARFDATGVFQLTNPTTFSAGTAALPSITATGDTNTGIFFPAADTIAFSEGGAEAMRIDSSGNVGIGIDSPAFRLQVRRAGGAGSLGISIDGVGSVQRVAQYLAVGDSTSATTGHAFYVRNGTATDNLVVLVDSSGNVGIGTSAPSSKLEVSGGSGAPVITLSTTGSIPGAAIKLLGATGVARNWQIGASFTSVNGSLEFTPSTTNGGSTFSTPAVSIDSGGNLLVGTTISTVNPGVSIIPSGRINIGRSNDDAVAEFYRSGTRVGQINVTTTATIYITSSDYRLKEAIAPMTGALTKVSQLKPVTYKWKSDGSDAQGFIAHELQAVVPEAVVGDKDAVGEEQYEVTPAVKDADGNTITEAVMGTRTVPVYQGIDTSFLVATLTAAIQEQQALITALTATTTSQTEAITALTARIAALESTP